tara:strand:+ start:251056 stop:253371 length:2316 start_codon:yes stop_codon:yes gene_type:complete
MQFAKAHKVTTYLVVMSSFLAVAFSGLLNPVIVLLALVGIGVSWIWEPPRINFDKWALPWTIFAVLVFLYETLSVVGGSEILLAGAEFLVTLMLTKLFNRRESKDYMHIYLLSFLLLTAGTVLNAEVTYGFFFLCYVVSFTWAMTIFHLRRELESNFLLRHSSSDAAEQVRVQRVMNSKRIVGRKFFLGTSLVSLAVFASALSLFLLFPRIGFGFFFDKGRGGISMAGFNEGGVELGGHGLIKQDTTVVMRVEVDTKYAGRRAPSIHWRGAAFDDYSEGKWRRSKRAPKANKDSYVSGGVARHHLLYDKPRLSDAQLESRQSNALKQKVYLEPMGNSVLFGASMPLTFELENKLKTNTQSGKNDELRQHHDAGLIYTVLSNPNPPSAQALRGAGTTLPKGFEVYLQLPEEIPECATPSALPVGPWTPADITSECRVRDLARWITRDAKTRYDKVLALETWLRKTLGYTLQMESPGEMEPVEFFLFQRQLGHCEYFSSAMAIMTRALGIPSRNVNGFLGGEWNEYDNFIAVRAGDAHSWVEVYFPGEGWVTFDPTPAGESDLLGRGSSSMMDRMRRIADTIRFKWFKWVIEYDLYAQLNLFRNFGRSVKNGANQYFRDPLRRAGTWAKQHRKTAGLLVIAVAVLFALVSYWRRRKSIDKTLLAPRASQKRRSPIVKHYLATLRSLAKRGHRRDDAITPREFARDLSETGVPGAKSLEALTELYYRAEYDPRQAGDGHAATSAQELSRAVLEALKKAKYKRGRASKVPATDAS